MSPEEFDSKMRELVCAICGAPHEPSFVSQDGFGPVFCGGVLYQKLPAMQNDATCWVVVSTTICASCLAMLQQCANQHRLDQVLDEDQGQYSNTPK